MKIFSLNCNKFGGGKEDNGRGEIFLKECMDNVILLAKTFLSLEEDNIIILQEVPYGREQAKKFKEKFEKEKYIQEVCAQGRKRTYQITGLGARAYREEIQRLSRCLADARSEGGFAE